MISLKTLAEATEQEIFDQVATHLLKQGLKSELGDTCAYRGYYGLKCAAGCLISDEEYEELFETVKGKRDKNCMPWYDLVFEGIVPTTAHSNLIGHLQDIHDNYPVEKWAEMLQKVAFFRNLNTSKLDAAAISSAWL
jgi:hypothetical protein